MNILVSEVFYSFQGEGPFAGEPRAFVRLATNCPLSCKFCDTRYARTKSRKLTSRDSALINKYPFIVITGNEPLYGAGPDYIKELFRIHSIQRCEIETNGVIIPDDTLFFLIDFWVISPKDPEMQLKSVDTRPQLLRKKSRLKDFIVKFVYDNNDKFILNTVSQFNIPTNKVWIMPRGETREVYLKNLPKAWDFALRHSFCLSPRLHVEAFNTRKGI